jgi:hypothetical protein
MLIPILSFDMPTFRALLTRIRRIDPKHRNSPFSGFIRDKLLELIKRPGIEPVASFLAPAGIFSDSGQVFQHQDRFGKRSQCIRYDFLGNPVIRIGHKPFFPPAQGAQFAPGGSGAFGLTRLAELLVFVTNILYMSFFVEPGNVLGIYGDSEIQEAHIDSDKPIALHNAMIILFSFDSNIQEELMVAMALAEHGRSNSPLARL